MEKIIQDHKRKSHQLKEARKKNKQSISVNKLKEQLEREKSHQIKEWNYEFYAGGEVGFDDVGYSRDETRKEARIELLEELIYAIENPSK